MKTMRFFFFGLICYFVSSILVVWLLFDARGSCIVTTIYFLLVAWLWQKLCVFLGARSWVLWAKR